MESSELHSRAKIPEQPVYTRRALAGINIIDLGWLFTVPIATKTLAEHGATVVKVESQHHIDPIRTFLPMADDKNGVDRALQFAHWNDSKYSLALNLKHPSSREVMRPLVQWADIVIENMTPGALERTGYGYDVLREFRPDIILVRASLEGQQGPYATRSALGIVFQGLAGLVSQVGWPDRSPVQIPLALTDFTGCEFVAISVMAALEYRRRTGKGQCIDLSQHETGEYLLLPQLLDAAMNGKNRERTGNRSDFGPFQGVYRCLGEDRWCAISIADDTEWQRLCEVMNMPELGTDPRFATAEARARNAPDVDRNIEGWTASRPPGPAVNRLQAFGVRAGSVNNCRDLNLDPQLSFRQHYRILPHPEIGRVAHDTPAFRLSETPYYLEKTAPCLGEHTEFVCRELLKFEDTQFVRLMSEGVFE